MVPATPPWLAAPIPTASVRLCAVPSQLAPRPALAGVARIAETITKHADKH